MAGRRKIDHHVVVFRLAFFPLFGVKPNFPKLGELRKRRNKAQKGLREPILERHFVDALKLHRHEGVFFHRQLRVNIDDDKSARECLQLARNRSVQP